MAKRKLEKKNKVEGMYESARAAITQSCRMDGLNSRNVFSHNFGDWTSEIKVLGRFSLLGSLASWLVDGHLHFSVLLRDLSVRVCVQISSSCSNTGGSGLGATLVTLF